MDKELFLKPRLPTREVDLEVGTIVVRGLSRAERLACKGKEAEEQHRLLFSMVFVDPPMTADDVDAWCQAALDSEVETVLAVVLELSGLGEGAAKATYKSDAGEPG